MRIRIIPEQWRFIWSPIHYQDLDGAWKDMDDSLEEDTDFRNRKGALDISLHRMTKESRTVSMKKEKTSLSWGMEGCHGAKARKQQKNLVILSGNF